MSVPRVPDRSVALASAAVLGLVICCAALLAFHLRRSGHAEGDDFALYLRQARSLFDGDIGGVIADGRFSVLNSDPNFGPIAYPWVWPLVVSPFVHFWGFDYDRLKLVEIGAFCLWLVLFHGIVRRRLGRIVATAVIAGFATAPAYLAHTDELLSEFPQMVAIAVVLWWHDRIRSRTSLITASTRDLVVLGLLVVAAFNVRRESIVLVGVIAAMQLFDAWRAADSRDWNDLTASLRHSWRALLTPAAAFVVGALTAQLVLPTELLPSNSNSLGFVDDRWREAPRIVSDQLGLGERPVVGGAVAVVALAGALFGMRRRPLLDTPIVLLTLLTALAIGTHFRRIDRYWFQVTPWLVFLVASALLALARLLVDGLTRRTNRRSRNEVVASALAAAPLVAIVIAHLAILPGDISDVRDANSAGVQDGAAHPAVVEMLAAVDATTPPDAVVAYYRARTMTLLTDRRAFQTHDVNRIRADADYWVQRRDWGFWQPNLDVSTVRELGFVEVWSSDRYVIWCTECAD